MPISQQNSSRDLDALSRLTLAPQNADVVVRTIAGFLQSEREQFVALADSNHVVIRSLQVVAQNTTIAPEVAQWAIGVLEKEHQRIQNALTFLHHICEELEEGGCPTTVMKSLDHWPDLGNDLDLYTTADEQRVKEIMLNRLSAHIEPRSWGDRLANKWNFAMPGLPESGRSSRAAAGTNRRAPSHGPALRHAAAYPRRSTDLLFWFLRPKSA